MTMINEVNTRCPYCNGELYKRIREDIEKREVIYTQECISRACTHNPVLSSADTDYFKPAWDKLINDIKARAVINRL